MPSFSFTRHHMLLSPNMSLPKMKCSFIFLNFPPNVWLKKIITNEQKVINKLHFVKKNNIRLKSWNLAPSETFYNRPSSSRLDSACWDCQYWSQLESSLCHSLGTNGRLFSVSKPSCTSLKGRKNIKIWHVMLFA